MPSVCLNQRQVWIGDQPHALLSGELHYWRLNPRAWRPALQRIRALGLTIAASYVCWDYHEIAPGQYDFHGETDPQRDLIAFLDLVASEGLWLLLRPGPYIYSEWTNGGIPDRAVPYHRLHPAFQAAAAEYLSAVTAVIKPYLATQGGPIILVQAENEADPWPQYYEAQLGLGAEPGPFQDYLRERYGGDIAALNAAWGAHLDDFAHARAVTQPVLPASRYFNRYLDFVRFRHWHTAESVRWTTAQLRAGGVDVPIYTNAYTIYGVQDWRAQEAACDLAGPDLYPSPEFRQDPDEHRQFLHMLRYTRSYSRLPYIPEFEAGIWESGPALRGFSADHYRLASLSALLAGAVGWNWYMLVNRDNWVQSPITEWGTVRPALYDTFAEIVRVFRQLDPPRLEPLIATAASVDPLYAAARLPESGDAVLQALYAADIDYVCWDVNTGPTAAPLLFYAGGPWLSAEAQQGLIASVEAGGTLVFCQTLPDEAIAPGACAMPGVVTPDTVLGAGYPQRLRVALGDAYVTVSSPAFFAYDQVPGEPIWAERIADADPLGAELRRHTDLPVGQRYVVGYRLARGRGAIVCLGLAPAPELLIALHAWLGIPIYSRAESPRVSTSLFRSGEDFALIAVNLGEEQRAVRIAVERTLFGTGLWAIHDLREDTTITASLGETGALTLDLDAKSGTALRLSRVSAG